jgi:hypothetical protein
MDATGCDVVKQDSRRNSQKDKKGKQPEFTHTYTFEVDCLIIYREKWMH